LKIASLTEFARLSDSSCTRLLGTDDRIDPSVCPSITIRAAPNWPASLPTVFDHESDVGIVQLLDVFAVDVLGDLLVEVPRVGKEVDHHRLGQNFIRLALNGAGAHRREAHVVFVLLTGVLLFPAKLLDHREIHHLIERRLLGDDVDLLVEEIRRRPGALEVGGIVLIEEEIAVLSVVGRVRVAEHAQCIALRDRITGGHQLGDGLLGILGLELLHRVEDAARQPFGDVGIVLGEIRPRKPDIRDQLVRRRRGHENAIALHLFEVVDVGCPAHHSCEASIGVERGCRLECVLGELELHFCRLDPGVDERVQHEEMRRRILRQHDRLSAQVGHRLDRLADHDAITAVRPIDLLKDARHHPRVAAQPFEEQREHVEGGPADVKIAGRVRVAHRDGIVDEYQFELEVLATRRLPHLARLEAVIGVDDGTPTGPHVDGESNGAIHHRLVIRNALDGGKLCGRDVVVFLDGGDARAVRRFGSAFQLRELVLGDLALLTLRTEAAVPPECVTAEADDNEENGKVERGLGLSWLDFHGLILVSYR
jgi:hypothetical protein